MKILSLSIKNYRTLESVDLKLKSNYVAVCGPNDSGKTNIVRAIRGLLMDEDIQHAFPFIGVNEISIKDDFPKFSSIEPKDREIKITVTLRIHREKDAGLFQSVIKQLSINPSGNDLELVLTNVKTYNNETPEVIVNTLNKEYSGIEAQEVLNRIQSSKSILFHNSTQTNPKLIFKLNFGAQIRATSPEQQNVVNKLKEKVNTDLNKISKSHQKELEDLFGRLSTKYKVGLSMPTFDFSTIPFNITLGQKDFSVPLDEWGSGTINRTLILLILFRLRQISLSDPSANKITPILFIEEPESFLHPSAQAEFGRILQDLAQEFDVQVVVTTHSPYLLNLREQTANILLKRKIHLKQIRQTEVIDTTGDNWMQPFSLALGLQSDEFKPWRDLVFTSATALLLVEGTTDKDYFEMLRDDKHGANKLNFEGEILSYDGTGSLSNTVLLRFVKNRHKKLFVTYDLDAEKLLKDSLLHWGLKKTRHMLLLG